MRGLSLVAASGGHSSSRCAGLSLSRPLPLRGTSSRCTSSVVVAHGPSCSAACGILPDQGSNPCPLHRQADSQPLRHQGSPGYILLIVFDACFNSKSEILILENFNCYKTICMRYMSLELFPPLFFPLLAITRLNINSSSIPTCQREATFPRCSKKNVIHFTTLVKVFRLRFSR